MICPLWTGAFDEQIYCLQVRQPAKRTVAEAREAAIAAEEVQAMAAQLAASKLGRKRPDQIPEEPEIVPDPARVSLHRLLSEQRAC